MRALRDGVESVGDDVRERTCEIVAVRVHRLEIGGRCEQHGRVDGPPLEARLLAARSMASVTTTFRSTCDHSLSPAICASMRRTMELARRPWWAIRSPAATISSTWPARESATSSETPSQVREFSSQFGGVIADGLGEVDDEVEGIVQLVRDAGRHLTECGQLLVFQPALLLLGLSRDIEEVHDVAARMGPLLEGHHVHAEGQRDITVFELDHFRGPTLAQRRRVDEQVARVADGPA